MQLNIPYQNQTLTLTMPSPEEILKTYNKQIDAMQDFTDDLDSAKFYGLEEVDAQNTIIDINNERKDLENLLSDISNEKYDRIVKTLNTITKTTKGVFRKNSVGELFVIASATDYFTDFTNAWSTMVLKLRAVAPTKIEMVFETKTYTL